MTGVGWLGVLVFVVGVLASVMLHEAGHFVTARRFGMKATEFFVGFGPKLWSFRRGETEYGFKGIPAGGYVKIVGMTDLEPVATEDLPRAFFRQRAWKRAVVLSAGSATHILLGLVLLFAAYAVFGESVQSTTISQVTTCVPTTAQTPTCRPGDPAAPAAAAGFRPGDVIVSVDGKPVSSAVSATEAIRSQAGRSTAVTVERDGKQQTLTVVPLQVQRYDVNDPHKVVTVGAIGVAFGYEQHRYGPVQALSKSVSGVWQTVTASLAALAALPAKVVELTRNLFDDQPRDPNGLVGIVGAANISGQLAQDSIPVAGRISNLLLLLAGFNIFVGLFNMLPLLPLDGGHVAVLGYERLRAWWARRRGQPEPPRPDMNKLLPVAYAVFILFVGLTVLLVTADILKPVQL
jgi:membrane-associated protease RseP (regulator of RpoE activity)